MGSSHGADRVEGHKAVLRDLTSASGAINTESQYASHRVIGWFDQETRQPLPSREAVQKEIIRDFRSESPAVRRGSQAILLAGPPGAGKTTAQDEVFSSTGTSAADWRILNADDFKDRLFKRAMSDGSYDSVLTPPEVSKLEAGGEKVWPRERAALVHEESSMLMKRARDQSMRQGENLIIDGTLGDTAAGLALVNRLAGLRYSVRVVLVDGPREVTEARVIYRWTWGYEDARNGVPDPNDPDLLALGGRWVPAEVTQSLYRDGDKRSVCSASAQTIADRSTVVTRFDGYRVTEPGGKPLLFQQYLGKRRSGHWARTRLFAH